MSNQRLGYLLGISAALVFAPPAQAEWKGKAELGLVLARGNTDSKTITSKADVTKELELWKHSAGFSTLYSSAVDDETGADKKTGDRFEVHAQSDYKFSERSYVFGSVRYEEDRFSAYSYQGIVAIGYGYRFIDTEDTKLSTEVGAGYRRTEDRNPPHLIVGDTVGRGRLAYEQKLTASTKIYDTFLVEAGEENTFLQNEAGVQVSMTEMLALSVAYVVRHNTDVPVATPPDRQRQKTDQLLTISLVASF